MDELHAAFAATREQKQQLQRDLAVGQTGVRAARVEVDHLEQRATTI